MPADKFIEKEAWEGMKTTFTAIEEVIKQCERADSSQSVDLGIILEGFARETSVMDNKEAIIRLLYELERNP